MWLNGLVSLVLVPCAFGQVRPVSFLAERIVSDYGALATHPTLAEWRKTHAGERLVRPHRQRDDESFDGDDQLAWCISAVAALPGDVTRTATFHVSEVVGGKLPPLPDQPDSGLIQRCRLQEVFYRAPVSVGRRELVRELAKFWGPPNDNGHRRGDRWRLTPAAGGALNFYVMEHVGEPSVVHIGFLPSDRVARMRRGDADEYYLEGGFPCLVAGELARIANLHPPVLFVTCDARQVPDGPHDVFQSAARVLKAAAALPPERQAAALAMVDLFIQSQQYPDEWDWAWRQFTQAGVKVRLEYRHDYAAQAIRLDPHSRVAELARLARISFCESDPTAADRLLADFPADELTPYIQYARARAHDSAMMVAMFGWADDFDVKSLHPDPAKMQAHRTAAIEGFRAYIAAHPDSPQAVYAWREAWKLLAGLPPSFANAGCTGE